MKIYLKNHKLPIISVLMLSIFYFVTRLTNLGLIPIFTDEAIYLRWSQIMASDASLRYLPLVDGKPPLFMWLTAIVIKLLPHLDVLLTGRLVSVGAGLFSLAGVAFTSFILFKNTKITLLSVLLYILVPFTFFYDRFGLADSLLAAFGIWSLGLGILLVRTLRLDVALILGMIIGLGLLTKTPALFFLAYLPFQLLVFDWKSKNWKSNLLKLAGLFLIVTLISQAIFSILRLFPLFQMIGQKNMEFILSPREFLLAPFELFFSNFRTLALWEIGYLTPLVALAIGISIKGGKLREKLVLLTIFIIHFLYMSTFNKSIFPRFLLTFTPGLLILSAAGIFEATKKSSKSLFIFSLFLIFSLPLFTDFKLLTDPQNAPIPGGDSNQYINAWPAGYGINQIRQYFSSESKKYPKIAVGTEGTFGLMPYALQIYQKEFPSVEIKAYWPLSTHVPKELNDASKNHPTFFLIYQQQTDPPLWPLELVAKFRQGKSNDYLRLYKISPR